MSASTFTRQRRTVTALGVGSVALIALAACAPTSNIAESTPRPDQDAGLLRAVFDRPSDPAPDRASGRQRCPAAHLPIPVADHERRPR